MEPLPAVEQCDNCRFWLKDSTELTGRPAEGVCRAHPPSKVSNPVTTFDWWCGEWQPRPIKQTTEGA